MKQVYNKVYVNSEKKRMVRKLFFCQEEMKNIEKQSGLTERVIRRIATENQWIRKRERYLRFLANYGFRHGIPLSRLSRKTGVLIYALCRIKRKYKIPDAKFDIWNKRINDETEQEFARLYESGLSAQDIAEKFGFKRRETVYNVLEKRGIGRREAKIQTEYNEDFFKKIDSHEKAYILGLILTDGYIVKDYSGFGIQLTETDGYILEKIANLLGKSAKVKKINCDGKRKTMPNARDMVRLTVHNRNMAKDLERLGVVRNKSKILRYNNCVQKKYLSSLFRGIIDGDGTIGKDGRGYYFAAIASASIVFCQNLYYANTPFEWGINNGPCYQLRIKNGQSEVFRFYKWIYKNKNDLYLRRKYEKVKDKIC